MADPFRLTVGWFGDTPALRLAGALRFGEPLTPIHDAVMRRANEGHQLLVIDVAGVEAADSSGLSALLDIARVFGGHRDGRVLLLHPSERLLSALALIRVTSLFEIVDSEAELLSRLGPWRRADT